MQTQLFSNRCFINNRLQAASLVLENGKIAAIHPFKTPEAIDLGDAVLMPACIDAHVHINEPGRTLWEGFETATQAAAAGGIASLIDMPLNSSPVSTTRLALEAKKQAALGKMAVNCGFYGGLVPNNEAHLEELMEGGVLGIKCFLVHSGIDEFENATEKELRHAMPILAKHHIPLLVHCELPDDFQHDFDKHPSSYQHYLASRPKRWENRAIDFMIDLCREFQCRVHIVHVASDEALASIAAAKSEGLPLTAETCAHYIYYSAEQIPDGNTLFKCAPPIREKSNNQNLKKALQSGILDFITTDHSPAPPSVKELESGNLQKAWGGIASVQFLLPAAWSALKNEMDLETFIPLLTSKPAQFLGIDHFKGKIELGYDADLVVWQPEQIFEVKTSDILFRHKISPYIGEFLYGAVERTIVAGNTIFINATITQTDKGTWLLKK